MADEYSKDKGKKMFSESTAEVVGINSGSTGWCVDFEAYTKTLSEPETEVDSQEAVPDFSNLCLTLDQWAQRKIKSKDFLLGEIFSTTTRAILSADTGLGKTHFGFAVGFSMAAGLAFCHWAGTSKPCRILILDGEMSAELVQERLADAERRHDVKPESIFVLCKEDAEDMPPLDTPEGQHYVESLIQHVEGISFVIFDNLGSLTTGNLAESESWQPMLPWIRSLTKQRIGQLWINHTGRDKTRDYGTRTRLWQMDTAMVAQMIEGTDADIAFRLEFTKARQRKPSNRADYETVDLVLDNDQWTTTTSKTKKKRRNYGANQTVLLDCLDTTLATAGQPSPGLTGMPTNAIVTKYGLWEKLCLDKLGQPTERRRRQAFNDAAEGLINADIGKLGDYIWRI